MPSEPRSGEPLPRIYPHLARTVPDCFEAHNFSGKKTAGLHRAGDSRCVVAGVSFTRQVYLHPDNRVKSDEVDPSGSMKLLSLQDESLLHWAL